MRIGELAEVSGMSREALRYWERLGLIRAERLDNGYRSYPAETVDLVRYIRTAQRLGFTLSEIGDELPALWDDPAPGPAIARVLQAKLTDIDARIAALQSLRTTLAERLPDSCPLQPGDAARPG